LSRIGGATVEKIVKNILKRLICPELRKQLTYTGKRTKKSSYSQFENINAVVVGE
jgi:hypothetical protein